MYEQLEHGEHNPAKIYKLLYGTRAAADGGSAFLNTEVTVENRAEREKAIKETIYKVVEHGIYAAQQRAGSDRYGGTAAAY